MNNYYCYDADQVHRVLEMGGIPQICGSFFVEINQQADIYVLEGKPSIKLRGSNWGSITVFRDSAPYISVYDSNSYDIRSYGNTTPHISTYHLSTPNIDVSSNSKPFIETCDKSAPKVYGRYRGKTDIVAQDSSSPHIILDGYGDVKLQVKDFSEPLLDGNMSVEALDETPTIRLLRGPYAKIQGKATIKSLGSNLPLNWVNFFDLPVVDGGYVYLYKTLDENFCPMYGDLKYLPGTTCEAPDWDPQRECGWGLHFSPSPMRAKEFRRDGVKFVACKVKIDEIVVHSGGFYPEKVKAPRVYEIFEVDILGKRI